MWWISKGLASVVYKFFDKKTSPSRSRLNTLATWNKFEGGAVKNENMSNLELAEELHKPIIRKF